MPPFVRRIDFSGRLVSRRGAKTPPLHIRIQYALDAPSSITGEILGTPREAKKILGVVGDHPLRLESIRPRRVKGLDDSSSYIISSNNLFLTVGPIERADSTMNITHVHNILGKLAFNHLEMSLLADFGTLGASRTLDYHLVGPSSWWGLYQWQRVYPDGTADYYNETRPSREIFRDEDQAVVCSVHREYLYHHDGQGGYTARTSHVLRFQSENPDMPEGAFISYCEASSSYILGMISFVSEQHIGWFRRSLTSRCGIRETVRPVWANQDEMPETGIEFGPVRKSEVYDFIKRGLINTQDGHITKDEYQVYVGLYVAGCTARFAEEKFISLFRLLEKFVSDFGTSENASLLSKCEWGKLRSALLKTFSNFPQDDEPRWDAVKEALNRANRKPIKLLFDEMMKTYDVPWRDVADQEKPFSFIDLRHEMMHQPKQIEFWRLDADIIRLKAVVRRLIIRMHGWYDYEQAGWECKFLGRFRPKQ